MITVGTKEMTKAEIARELGISKSYLSMILNGNRKLTPELAEKLQIIPGVHKVVNSVTWESLYTQEVRGSSPLPPTINQPQSVPFVLTIYT